MEKSNNLTKLDYLDGMRGLMSINVILCHFVTIFFPQMYLAEHSKGDFLSLFGSTPLNVFVNGNIAVCYFFVLTGFLSARSVYVNDYTLRDLRIKFINRYLRFIPIVTVATFFVFLTMKFNLQTHRALIGIPEIDSEFLGTVCNFEPSIMTLVRNCFVNTFTSRNDFIIPFWCLSYEFIGYIIVYIVSFFLKDSKYRRLVYIIFVLFVPTGYNSFLMGALVADLIYNKNRFLLSNMICSFNKKVFIIITFFIGLYCSCCPMTLESIYSIWKIIPREEYDVAKFIRSLGMAIIIYVMYNSKALQKIMMNPINMFLGKISFSIYSFHFPIMITVETFIFKLLLQYIGYTKAAWLSLLASFPIIIVVSYLSWLIVENCIKLNIETICSCFKKVKKFIK